jgi:hypothetical protein
MSEPIKVGMQAFTSDGDEEFGAVRALSGHDITVYVENSGEFVVPASAVTKVGFGKVTFDCKKLDGALKRAIGHAHDAETE